jgi:hypothetical protein
MAIKSPNLPVKLGENLAVYFGVSGGTVARWAKNVKPFTAFKLAKHLDFLKVKNGTTQKRLTSPMLLTDLQEIFAECGLEDRQNLPSEQTDEPLTLDAARLRKIQLETERIQLGLDRDRGDVVSRVALREAGVRIGAALAAAVAALDNDLPGLLAGKSEVEIRAAVTPRLARMQEQFNESLMEIVDEPDR